jgi:hypothetical protein
MSTYIDTEQIELEDNQEYEYQLFQKLLKSVDRKENLPAKYYYQYEFDSNQTPYEKLADNNLIAIKACSLEEANVLNIILRVVIDGHGGWLHSFTSDEDDETIPNLTEEAFFNSIKKGESLTMYEGYVSDELKPMKNKNIDICFFSKVNRKDKIINFNFKNVKVFDYTEVEKLLHNIDESDNRLLNILK